MQQVLPRKDVVLLGVGHTNAHVLRMWRMHSLPDTQLTCVSNYPIATYSGMVPGVLAGQYQPERMEIDLVRLCAAAGARLIVSNVTGLDVATRELLFEDRPPVRFDVLSIGIGSLPRFDGAEILGNAVLPIKPMQTFLERLERQLLAWKNQQRAGPLRVCVVGGGAGGVEITLCLPARIRAVLGDVSLQQMIVNAHQELLPGARAGTVRTVHGVLEERGVRLHLGRRVTRVDGETITLDNGETLGADLVLWATSATAPPLLPKLGLPVDADGFLLTHATLQTVADAPIFAVGDSGTIRESPVPKAGVYAVREGPILWQNIGRVLRGRPLVSYTPQRGFMKLLNTGDGKAILEYKWVTLRGRWCWRLKNRIDSKFMAMYQDYTPMPMPAAPPPAPGVPMRCAGCGGKVAASVLSRALSRLSVPASDNVLVGLDQPDDVAVVQFPGGHPITVTVDFFAAPLDDPYLVGRIAALNALSDVFAKGARPKVALALATLPAGVPRQQEQLLFELLAGSLEEFRKAETTLVGGHTIEGSQLTAGFTILADQGTRPLRPKGGLRVGDRLVLTKRLGTGILLAAHMRALCKAQWLEELLQSMLLSNQAAAELADEFDITGVTDITGFGLAGHLLEMLRASGHGARLGLHGIRLLRGVKDLIRDHRIESTLAPANRAVEEELSVEPGLLESDFSPRYAALFDPQTCGGLLLGVPPNQIEAVMEQLSGLYSCPPYPFNLKSLFAPSVIGSVEAYELGQPRIRVVRW